MKKITPFEEYLSSLSDEEQSKLKQYFHEFDLHNSLPIKERNRLRGDFEKAFMIYTSMEISIDVAMERLNLVHLGGFYSRPAKMWYPLDDAAKIYPVSMRHGQMAVFRLAAYLKDQKVIPEMLQIALNFTIKRFPSFATTVKKGFFWHYLDATKRRYNVEEESGIPCKPLNVSKNCSPSFRVSYYENRISVEYFHILTDGSGGMIFLKTLLSEYLKLVTGVKVSKFEGVFDIDEQPKATETTNDFYRAENVTNNHSGFVDKAALQMSGKLSRNKPCRVYHFRVDKNKLKEVAKSYGGTVTSYIATLMLIAIKSATDETYGDISIQVPVNMRKYYPSETLKNFSMYFGIRMPIGSISDISGTIGEASQQVKKKSSMENMSEMMRSTERFIKLLQFVPLIIKVPFARFIYGFLGDVLFTSTLSNLGIVTLPEELKPYVSKMDFVLGIASINRTTCGIVTYEDVTTLTVTKLTTDPSFEDRFLDLLEKDGLNPEIEGSDLYED